MNKFLSILFCSTFLFSQTSYYGSTTAPVAIAGGIIRAKHITDDTTVKYKRKNCPVCKGKGWYMSGDKIKKIDCTYCEPTEESESGNIKHNQSCPNGVCPLPKTKR